ncbi:hypothetical protein J6590_108354 [Homalodisca vitripennis]|nr:hypothetical protein J6590_108354 [Homalodisca vitripennis]
MNKLLRRSGEAYMGLTRTKDGRKVNIEKRKRRMGQTCNSNLCAQSRLRYCNLITEEQRKELFRDFWENLSWDEKKEYIVSMVEKVEVNRRRSRSGNKSRRNITLKYHFVLDGEKIQVCQTMFCRTLDITKNFVKYWLLHSSVKHGPLDVEWENDFESEFYDEIEIHDDFETMGLNEVDNVGAENKYKFYKRSHVDSDEKDVQNLILEWE